MAIIDTRFAQMFPVLDGPQIESAKRFASGEARSFAPGEVAYEVGERNAPSWLVLGGSFEVLRGDGLHRQASVISLSPGQFSGEVGQLSGTGTLARVRGGPEGGVALPFDPAHIRALVIGSADI